MALKRAAHARLLFDAEEQVGGRGGRRKALAARPGGAAPGADLGGSSNYSSENLEGRSGEGFRANGAWTRVSRS